eukprot:366279-Chlamydomonas_euryale.AAC.1
MPVWSRRNQRRQEASGSKQRTLCSLRNHAQRWRSGPSLKVRKIQPRWHIVACAATRMRTCHGPPPPVPCPAEPPPGRQCPSTLRRRPSHSGQPRLKSHFITGSRGPTHEWCRPQSAEPCGTRRVTHTPVTHSVAEAHTVLVEDGVLPGCKPLVVLVQRDRGRVTVGAARRLQREAGALVDGGPVAYLCAAV